MLFGLAMSPIRSSGIPAARTGQASAAPRETEYMLVMPMLARDGSTSAPTRYLVSGTALAGPTCPVEQLPPDDRCSPRPVNNAVLLFIDQAGRQAAEAVTDADGHFAASLPPGTYTLVAQPVEGLLREPPPETVVVNGPVVLTVRYDTGIR